MLGRLFRFPRRGLLLGLWFATAIAAAAEPYPARPIELVVPYPPGASVDFLARLIQPKMAEALGQQVVVENRAGAGSNIGSASVARATPDGYRILLATNAGLTINPHVYKEMGFDVLKDLAPVDLLAAGPLAIAVSSNLNVSTLPELVAYGRANPGKLTYGRANPGKLTYGTPGAGSPQHLVGELLSQEADIDMTHVPYRGVGPALTDLMGGNINVVIATLAAFTPHLESDRLKIVAMADAERFPGTPDIPTVAETYPGFEASAWFGLMAPAGTPADVVQKLHQAAAEAIQSPDVQKALRTASLNAVGEGPEALDKLMRADYERWGKVVRDKGITAN